MSQVIDFPAPPSGGSGGWEHVICDRPLRMRWGFWRTPHAIQVHLQSAAVWEDYRAECQAQGKDPSAQMPAGFVLEGGLHYTALALLRHREDEAALQDVGYLAALMEALLNTPCAILRTDLIRRVYQEVEALSTRLGVRWRGGAQRFMLPLNQDARDPHHFARRLAPLADLQEFFDTLRQIARERHQALAQGYVLYYPRRGGL